MRKGELWCKVNCSCHRNLGGWRAAGDQPLQNLELFPKDKQTLPSLSFLHQTVFYQADFASFTTVSSPTSPSIQHHQQHHPKLLNIIKINMRFILAVGAVALVTFASAEVTGGKSRVHVMSAPISKTTTLHHHHLAPLKKNMR